MCMCVCVCVCVYVYDSVAAKTDGWILMKFSNYDLTDICEVLFFFLSDFDISNPMTS